METRTIPAIFKIKLYVVFSSLIPTALSNLYPRSQVTTWDAPTIFMVSISRPTIAFFQSDVSLVMSHVNATIQPNKTVTGGSVAHVGQIYFDQALIDQVELTAPYNANTEFHLKNAQDFLMSQASTNGSDPVVEYVFLGSKVEDGIMAWVNFGIDPNYNRVVNAASMCSEAGCVKNPKAMGPPPGGFPPGGFPKGGPGGFPFPSGFSFPSGFPFPKGPKGPGGMGPPPMGPPPEFMNMPKQAAPSTAVPSAKATSHL
jgi:hypothetical protein